MSPNDTPTRKIRLLIEYDGSRYVGWQAQRDLPSIEAEICLALQRLTGEAVSLTVAGRTDAGVHAVGQVASFRTRTTIPEHRLAPGLNHYLPDDVSIHSAREVEPAFNARHDSLGKLYRYRIFRSPHPAALERRAWHIRRPLDLGVMRSAAALLLGERDFNAFRSTACEAPHAIREIFSIEVESKPRPPAGERVEITFHANAYCRHMCRIMAGTLVEVGMGKRPAQSIAATLASRDRTQAGITAPPHGLTLMEVRYPP